MEGLLRIDTPMAVRVVRMPVSSFSSANRSAAALASAKPIMRLRVWSSGRTAASFRNQASRVRAQASPWGIWYLAVSR